MPLFDTIMWFSVHCILAIGLNMICKWFNIINYGEVFGIYFAILAFRTQDVQYKFTKSYREDPDLVESILREQYDRGD